jgi:DNA-binding transcriptional ArsR family regulator
MSKRDASLSPKTASLAAAPDDGRRGQKADLFKWVNDQQALDMRTKFILKELASYAGPDCCAWSEIKTLAYAANCTDRTVQYHLAALRTAGLIRLTDRTHRLEGSTRSVPVYQLAPGVEGLDPRCGMGAKIAPILGGDGCNADGGMGATGLHPHMRTGEQSGDKSPSPGVREREAVFRDLEAATPRAVLKFADRDAAFAALCALADEGVDIGQLPDCARRMSADPVFRSRKFPEPLHGWIAKGQWRGWLPEPAAEVAAGPATAVIGVAFAGPADLRVAVVAAEGEAFARTYFDMAAWVEGPPARLVPRTGVAEDQLKRRLRRLFSERNIIVERERA